MFNEVHLVLNTTRLPTPEQPMAPRSSPEIVMIILGMVIVVGLLILVNNEYL